MESLPWLLAGPARTGPRPLKPEVRHLPVKHEHARVRPRTVGGLGVADRGLSDKLPVAVQKRIKSPSVHGDVLDEALNGLPGEYLAWPLIETGSLVTPIQQVPDLYPHVARGERAEVLNLPPHHPRPRVRAIV